MTPNLAEIVSFLDGRLNTRTTGDYSNALNGLQLANNGSVTRVAAAVDASVTTITRAVEAGHDLLLVHHGMFWGGLQPIVGNLYRLYETAIRGNLAIYSVHLPLDAGEEGNSALLANALSFGDESQSRWVEWEPCHEAKGVKIGVRGRLEHPVPRETLAERLGRAVGGATVRVCPGGPEMVRDIVVVTGGAGSEVRAIAQMGADTLITGEGPHWTYALAEEVGVNILYGGHYATETFGVKALAKTLSERFNLPWDFIDSPTGL